jgi:hypothetical protein
MDGDQLAIKCLLKLIMLNFIQQRKFIFIIIKNKCVIKNILKNKELYILYLLVG